MAACPICGQEVDDSATECPICGAALLPQEGGGDAGATGGGETTATDGGGSGDFDDLFSEIQATEDDAGGGPAPAASDAAEGGSPAASDIMGRLDGLAIDDEETARRKKEIAALQDRLLKLTSTVDALESQGQDVVHLRSGLDQFMELLEAGDIESCRALDQAMSGKVTEAQKSAKKAVVDAMMGRIKNVRDHVVVLKGKGMDIAPVKQLFAKIKALMQEGNIDPAEVLLRDAEKLASELELSLEPAHEPETPKAETPEPGTDALEMEAAVGDTLPQDPIGAMNKTLSAMEAQNVDLNPVRENIDQLMEEARGRLQTGGAELESAYADFRALLKKHTINDSVAKVENLIDEGDSYGANVDVFVEGLTSLQSKADEGDVRGALVLRRELLSKGEDMFREQRGRAVVDLERQMIDITRDLRELEKEGRDISAHEDGLRDAREHLKRAELRQAREAIIEVENAIEEARSLGQKGHLEELAGRVRENMEQIRKFGLNLGEVQPLLDAAKSAMDDGELDIAERMLQRAQGKAKELLYLGKATAKNNAQEKATVLGNLIIDLKAAEDFIGDLTVFEKELEAVKAKMAEGDFVATLHAAAALEEKLDVAKQAAWDSVTELADDLQSQLGILIEDRAGEGIGAEEPKEMYHRAVSLREKGKLFEAYALLKQSRDEIDAMGIELPPPGPREAVAPAQGREAGPEADATEEGVGEAGAGAEGAQADAGDEEDDLDIPEPEEEGDEFREASPLSGGLKLVRKSESSKRLMERIEKMRSKVIAEHEASMTPQDAKDILMKIKNSLKEAKAEGIDISAAERNFQSVQPLFKEKQYEKAVKIARQSLKIVNEERKRVYAAGSPDAVPEAPPAAPAAGPPPAAHPAAPAASPAGAEAPEAVGTVPEGAAANGPGDRKQALLRKKAEDEITKALDAINQAKSAGKDVSKAEKYLLLSNKAATEGNYKKMILIARKAIDSL